MNPFAKHRENKLHGTRGAILDVSWNHDGSTLTAAETKGPARLWRLEHGGHKQGEELRMLGSSVERLAWSPSTTNVLAASVEKTVQLWDQRTRKVTGTLGMSDVALDTTWSGRSGKFFASACRDNSLTVYDMANTKQPVVSVEIEGVYINTARWSADETHMLVSTYAGNVEVFTWPTFEHVHTMRAHSASCNWIAVDAQAGLVATGGTDASLTLWNPEDFSVAQSLRGYEYPVRLLAFNRSGRFLASAADDLDIRIHDVYSHDLVKAVPLASAATALEWHPRSLALAYASGDGHSPEESVRIFAPESK